MGRVPKEWEVATLGSKAIFVTSGSRGWANFYSDVGPLFLRIGNLTREHINLRLNDIVRVKPPMGREGDRTRVQPGDVLISITADLGIIGVIPPYFGEAYVNQHIALVRPQPINCSRWIGRYLAFGPTASYFRMLNDSGAKAGMNLPAIESLQIALPGKDEQDAVSAAIDTVDIDIVQQELNVDKLNKLKSGLMADLLTGRVRVTEDINSGIVTIN
jgi:type I restriction enzyme S subunit